MWCPELRPGHVMYVEIVEALARAIEDGALRAGDRLLPQREMAWRLGVNLATVSKAYNEATRRHLISGEVGRGTFVLASSREARLFVLRHDRSAVVDLSTNVPAPCEGEAGFADAVAGLPAEDRRDADRYSSPELLERARGAVHTWLAWRGLDRPDDAVLLCSGAQASLVAVLLSLRQAHATVLVEAHTFPGMKAVARQLGFKLVGVECDREGVVPEALASQARATGARLAVLVPNLQNPTGATMGEERRREVAAAAEANDILVIEDDVYGALTDRPPLQERLGPRGILIGSLSKCVVPGLRFGFVSGASARLAPIDEIVHATSWFTGALSLAVSAQWIADGSAFRRAAWQRGEVERRWTVMERVLGPTVSPPSPHAWLPVEGSSEAAAERCRALGVAVVPAPVFAVGRQDAHRVRICLTAAATPDALEGALHRLREAGVGTAEG